uniref:Uncharacterized protein n=1 Tax=Anopheles albimanus TaxID=7167 RepID=A0A182F2V9_ANOAL
MNVRSYQRQRGVRFKRSKNLSTALTPKCSVQLDRGILGTERNEPHHHATRPHTSPACVSLSHIT